MRALYCKFLKRRIWKQLLLQHQRRGDEAAFLFLSCRRFVLKQQHPWHLQLISSAVWSQIIMKQQPWHFRVDVYATFMLVLFAIAVFSTSFASRHIPEVPCASTPDMWPHRELGDLNRAASGIDLDRFDLILECLSSSWPMSGQPP